MIELHQCASAGVGPRPHRANVEASSEVADNGLAPVEFSRFMKTYQSNVFATTSSGPGRASAAWLSPPCTALTLPGGVPSLLMAGAISSPLRPALLPCGG